MIFLHHSHIMFQMKYLNFCFIMNINHMSNLCTCVNKEVVIRQIEQAKMCWRYAVSEGSCNFAAGS